MNNESVILNLFQDLLAIYGYVYLFKPNIVYVYFNEDGVQNICDLWVNSARQLIDSETSSE